MNRHRNYGIKTVWALSVLFLVASMLSLSYSTCIGKTVVTVATYNQVRGDLLEKFAKPLIQKRHPDIEVKVQVFSGSTPDVHAKLLTMMASDMAPDIFQTSPGYIFDFVAADALVDLTPYVNRDLNMADYFERLWMDGRYPYESKTGRIYGVPLQWVVSLLFYNKNIFDTSGVDYPSDSWTWDSVLAISRKFTRDTNGDGKVDQWGLNPPTNFDSLFPVIWSFGGEVLNEKRNEAKLTNPNTIKAIQFVVDMLHKHQTAQFSSFEGGRVGMAVLPSWLITTPYRDVIKTFDWDVEVVPKGPAGRFTYGGSDLWMVMKRPRQDIEAVWTVLKELISEDVVSLYVKGGHAPVCRSFSREFTERWLERNLPPRNKIAILKSAPYIRGAEWNVGWIHWITAMNKEFAPMFQGQRSVEESVAAATVAINALLKSK